MSTEQEQPATIVPEEVFEIRDVKAEEAINERDFYPMSRIREMERELSKLTRKNDAKDVQIEELIQDCTRMEKKYKDTLKELEAERKLSHSHFKEMLLANLRQQEAEARMDYWKFRARELMTEKDPHDPNIYRDPFRFGENQ